MKRKTVPSSLPKKKKDPCNTQGGGPRGSSHKIEVVSYCHRDLQPRGRSYPRFSSFLCKCNLSKN